MRSTAMRFSVPSSCACRSRKFCVALSSGYFSTTTSRRDRAPPSWPCACWNWSSCACDLGGPLAAWGDTCPTFARAPLPVPHKVGPQPAPPLVDVLHLPPLLLHRLVERHQ